MELVIDTSALIAVIAGEAERDRIISITKGCSLVGPGSIPWEVGNAFSAMFKQSRLMLDEAQKGINIFESIPIRYVQVDLLRAITIAKKTNMYAYDAYFLDCAIGLKVPLLTLDRKLKQAAQTMSVKLVEV
jgi:predicted nucleic acid-binding protein